MRIDGTLDFCFPAEKNPDADHRVVAFDKLHFYHRLANTWAFECECEKCPSHGCVKNPADCQEAPGCRVVSKNGLKAVDAVYWSDPNLYLIEVKDFSVVSSVRSVKTSDFSRLRVVRHYRDSVAKKFRDTIFAIWCGGLMNDKRDAGMQRVLQELRRRSKTVLFVFHFESPKVPYKSGFYRKQQAFRCVDMKESLQKVLGENLAPYLSVIDLNWMSQHKDAFPWSVSRVRP